MKVNIPLIIILSSLFIINFIVIATTPLENTINFMALGNPYSDVVTITNEYKVMYLFCYILLLLNIYIGFNYLLYRVEFRKQFAWLCIIVILFALVAVIYSYIVEHETYRLFFENIATTLRDYSPKSFTNYFNSYAAILLGAAFCSYGLYTIYNKSVFRIIALFFTINIIFPTSRLCMILGIALALMMFIYKMFISWKDHAFRNINFIVITLVLIGIFTLICINDPDINHYIKHVIFTDNTTYNSRELLWEMARSMVRDFHRYIGMGHGYFNTAFAIINLEHVKMPHNLYLQVYGTHGLVGLILFGLLLLFIIYKIIRLYKNNRNASLISIIGLITILAYYLLEG